MSHTRLPSERNMKRMKRYASLQQNEIGKIENIPSE